MPWIYRLCRRHLIDNARHALVSLPVLVPENRDGGRSMHAFVVAHAAVTKACRHLPQADPALPLLIGAHTLMQRWRQSVGPTWYERHDILVARLAEIERRIADLMDWPALSVAAA